MNRDTQKKVAKYAIITAIVIYVLFLCGVFWGDITQHKRIGKTHYYLMENAYTGAGTILSFRENAKDDAFLEIVSLSENLDIYWDTQYILVKDHGDSTIQKLGYKPILPCNYILKQSGRDDPSSPWVLQEYKSTDDYNKEIRSIKLDENLMQHTDGHIPWSLHLFD